MAFKINRSIIKGTANHKASIAKATSQSIVSQARTKADASLVWAGGELGKSYVPGAIDYTIDSPEIKIPEKSEKKEKSSEEWLEENQKKIDNATGKKRNKLIDKRNKYKKKKGIK